MKRSEVLNKIKTLHKIKALRFPMSETAVVAIQGKNGFENVTITDYPEKEILIADTGKFLGKSKIKYKEIFN